MKTQSAQIAQPRAKISQRILQRMLAKGDIELNGTRPFDIQVTDSRALGRILRHGSLGLGESYMDGQWECDRIDVLVEHLLRVGLSSRFTLTLENRGLALVAHLRNLQSRKRAGIVGKRHYDVGNALFEHMLDSGMNYSCAFWENADTLEQAQRAKMELVCRKLQLAPGMTLLDIGCGWGGMARYAAENYGVEVVGITVSEEQRGWAKRYCQNLPIEIRYEDFRDVHGAFDRVVSIGMFEHVGYKNYAVFFRKCHEVLRDDGLMLLHTIGSNTSDRSTDPWVNRYIFPNGMLPSIRQIGRAIEQYFVMEDWHNFGAYYDRTLMAWYPRIERAWDRLGDRYDERFRRMWKFYLLSCAGAFRARYIQLWQLVLAKQGQPGGYRRPSLEGL